MKFDDNWSRANHDVIPLLGISQSEEASKAIPGAIKVLAVLCGHRPSPRPTSPLPFPVVVVPVPGPAMDYDAYDAILHHIFKQVRTACMLHARR